MAEGSARVWVCVGGDRNKDGHVIKGHVTVRSSSQLLALEMKALPKDANVDVLISDVPKGERN